MWVHNGQATINLECKYSHLADVDQQGNSDKARVYGKTKEYLERKENTDLDVLEIHLLIGCAHGLTEQVMLILLKS